MAFTVRVASAGHLYLSQIVLARWMGRFECGILVDLGADARRARASGPNLDMIRVIPECRETGKTVLLRGGLLVAFGARHSKALVGAEGLWLLAPHVENHYVLPLCLALVCAPMFALTDIQDGVGRGRAWMGIALMPPYVLGPLLLLVALAADEAISAT
jgi:O-antigen/teichoic acid export membrane protein